MIFCTEKVGSAKWNSSLTLSLLSSKSPIHLWENDIFSLHDGAGLNTTDIFSQVKPILLKRPLHFIQFISRGPYFGRNRVSNFFIDLYHFHGLSIFYISSPETQKVLMKSSKLIPVFLRCFTCTTAVFYHIVTFFQIFTLRQLNFVIDTKRWIPSGLYR